MNLAKLSLELDASSSKRAFRVIPAGQFRAIDGRPDGGYWTMTEQAGRAIIARLAARRSDVVIDYEHALRKSATDATHAIDVNAAGWYKTMEWRQDGLYVVDARWTDKALAQIEGKQYRYISPMFTHDKANNVVDLINFSLVAYPGIDGLTDLAALGGDLHNQHDPEREKIMWLLGLGPCPSGTRNAVALAATTAPVSDEISSQVLRAFGLSNPISQGQTVALSGGSSSSGGLESQIFRAFGLEPPAAASSMVSLAAHASTSARRKAEVDKIYRAFGLEPPR
ncbi:UNVERIFIED_ORG: phage protease [Shinella sp. XGS7]|nr:phage protease [Shinella sp. XGS7]